MPLHWPQAQSLVEQCQQVRVEIQDIENTCIHEQDNFDLDPAYCEQIQRNMQTWMELKHHYGPPLEQVIQAKKDLQKKLDRIENGETKIQEIRLKCHNIEQICREKANQLHMQREQCIPKLTQLVVQCLQTLGFQNPKFEIKFNPSNTLHRYGFYDICFQFASAKTLSCSSLDRVASSGELSRILLALKNVLHDASSVPVSVFDEIDANIGGQIGKNVGNLLKNLGQNSQVFCVTHLPQVAGQADSHYLVEKSFVNSIPTIQFKVLDTNEKRYHELARMLGDANSDSALNHAKTLLNTP